MGWKTLAVAPLCLAAGMALLWLSLREDGLPPRPPVKLFIATPTVQTGPQVERKAGRAPYAKPVVIDEAWIKRHSRSIPDLRRPLFTEQGAIVCPTLAALRRLLGETHGGKSGTFSDLGCGVMPGRYPVTLVWQKPGAPAAVSVLIHIDVGMIGNAERDLPVQAWTVASMLRN